MTVPRLTDLSKAKRIDLSSGVYACAWGLTDFYPDCLEKLKEALASGEDFQTERFDCKKELRYGRYTKANGQFKIEVQVNMDDLWESEDLIYDALWSACKMDIELPDEIIDSIRETASLIGVDDHTLLTSWLPGDATLDQILEATEELEGRCEMANEAMFDTLCQVVRDHVDFYNLKEED